MKNTITILLALAVIILTVRLAANLQEQKECYRWQYQNVEQLAQWQRDQCGAHHIELGLK